MKLFPNTVKKRLKELQSASGVAGLRSSFNALRTGFLQSPSTPVLRETKIERDKVRSLYYNTDTQLSNGAFVSAPIIDGTADFIGLPECTFDDPVLTARVNNWVKDYWPSDLWQIYRTMLRDSDVWVRLRKPFPNPLLAVEEEDVACLEVIDSDRVQPYYDPVTQELIRVEIDTNIFLEDQTWTPDTIIATGARTYGRTHLIREIITKDAFYYYDVTLGEFLENYQMSNKWGFVPCIQIFNDYDSALHGGKSDLEQVYPFIKALHDLIVQTTGIHAYHADPKVKFKLTDVMTFIQNNWPESIVNGKFTGKVSWRDRDVFFMESEEDADFIEATMKVSDSVSLAEFLIDCICMAAEVTEGILFRAHAEQLNANTDEFFRFKKKIDRKRNNFAPYAQQIVRMATKIVTGQAHRPRISWAAIDIADLAAEGQALNQITTSAEVANRAGVISKETYAHKIRRFYPGMQDPATEQAKVKAEQTLEQDQQVTLAQKMAKVQPPKNTNPPGPNSASSNGHGHVRLPLDIVPVSPGN